MSAILEFFRKLFGLFLGSGSSNETPVENTDTSTESEVTPEENIPPKEEEKEDNSTDTSSEETTEQEEEEGTGPLLEVSLARYSTGDFDILGKLKVNDKECETLEALSGIPAGEYSVKLRTEGGRHATYWYKFGDTHKGMLWIKNVPNAPFADIHIGNSHADAQKGIIVGTQAQNADKTDQAREVWYSEPAYEKIYTPIAKHLEDGGRVLLKITE